MNSLVLGSSGEPLLERTLSILFVILSFASKPDVNDGFLLILIFSDSSSSFFISQVEHLRSIASFFAVVIGKTELEKDILITCSATLSAFCSYSPPGRLTFNL